jgi:hypothetical protein
VNRWWNLGIICNRHSKVWNHQNMAGRIKP